MLKIIQMASLPLCGRHKTLLNTHLSSMQAKTPLHSLVLIFSLMMKEELFTSSLSSSIQKTLIREIDGLSSISMQTLVGVQMAHPLTPLLSQEIERYACHKFKDPEYLNLSLIYMLSLMARQKNYTQVNLYADLMAQIDDSAD